MSTRYETAREAAIVPQLLDVNGVAKLYAISPRSVWRLTKLGLIPPPITFGMTVTRWRVEDLLEHIKQLRPTNPQAQN